MADVLDNGKTNPLITVSHKEVWDWLRKVADDAGYSDREGCAVRINVTQPFGDGLTYHMETPSLTFVVSNIPNSR